MRYGAVFFLLLLSAIAGAQVELNPPGIWIDSLNLRAHVSSHMLTNILWGAQTQIADPHFSLARILRFEAAGDRRLNVIAKHYKLQQESLLLQEINPSAIARRLDELVQYANLEEQLQLQYDWSGYITQRIREDVTGDSLRTSSDTISYSYMHWKDGSMQVSVNQTHTDHNRNLRPKPPYNFFASTRFCGTITEGPLTMRQQGTFTFLFDSAGRPLRVHTRDRAWVNYCRNYDTADETIRIYQYDIHGRLVCMTDSMPLAVGHKVRDRTRFAYKDGPLRKEPLFNIPLIRRFILTLDRPYLSRTTYVRSYWDKEYGKGSDAVDVFKTDTQHYNIVRDRRHRLMLSVRKDNVEEPLPVLYREGRDSLSSYKVICQVYANIPYSTVPDTTSAVFDPSEPIHHDVYGDGDGERTSVVHPPGTLHVRSLECSDRTEIRGSDGWRMISYGGGNLSTATWFAPSHPTRYCCSAFDPTDFVLLDAKGYVRYVYDRGDFYVVEYR